MLATLLQEDQVIGWEFIDHPQTQAHQQAFILLVWVLLIVSLVIVIRLWFTLGLSQFKVRRRLDEVVDKLRSGDGPGISQAAASLPSRAPERGLKELVSIGPEEVSTGLQRILSRADALCRREYVILRVRISRLLTISVVAAFVTVLYFAFDLSYVLRAIQEQKAVPWRAVSGELAETMVGVSLGMILSAVTFISYRHFSGRIDLRQAYWKYFCNRCGFILSESKDS